MDPLGPGIYFVLSPGLTPRVWKVDPADPFAIVLDVEIKKAELSPSLPPIKIGGKEDNLSIPSGSTKTFLLKTASIINRK